MGIEQTKTANTTKAFGKNLTDYEGVTVSEINVPYNFTALQTLDEVPEDEKLEDEDILAVINARRNAAARANAVNKALADLGIKQPALTDYDKAVNGIVRSLVLMGTPEADARQMAETMLSGKAK